MATTEHENAKAANEVDCATIFHNTKKVSIGAATTTLACFGSRLTNVLLLAHKAGSKLSLCHTVLAQGSLKNSRFCRLLGRQNKSKTA
ncbi:hypothetical protein GXP67_33490 [Rhodocytophaga rosea]|uniref:Uncharacterized protein n=1 Tax=Rhodocytophaga rosea TaxID=2704465 RepID=A0A6C0GST7_9BACT|nr:hypothetical protein [Rhodocytophaga rosea]QHT71218.1 hypothetical protein GXP67_33490 [Rhodocytophaga rosea]